MGHTDASFDTDGSLSADTTITAGTGITSTAGNIVATAGAVTAGTDVTATRSVTGAAIYGPTPSPLTLPGFTVDGTNPATFCYVRLYDKFYQAYRNFQVYNGALIAG